jgi:hypothetical protein
MFFIINNTLGIRALKNQDPQKQALPNPLPPNTNPQEPERTPQNKPLLLDLPNPAFALVFSFPYPPFNHKNSTLETNYISHHIISRPNISAFFVMLFYYSELLMLTFEERSIDEEEGTFRDWNL